MKNSEILTLVNKELSIGKGHEIKSSPIIYYFFGFDISKFSYFSRILEYWNIYIYSQFIVASISMKKSYKGRIKIIKCEEFVLA